MEKEFTIFLIKIFIWEIGNKTNFLVMAFISILTVTNIKENLPKAISLDEASIHIKVALFTTVNGLKTEKVDLEFIFTLTNKNTKATG